MLGNSEMRGFFEISCRNCKTEKCHLLCSLGLQFLEKLMSPSCCKYSTTISNLFTDLSQKSFSKLGLERHLSCKGLTSCKRIALQLIDLYMNQNPSLRKQSLLKEVKNRTLHKNWQKVLIGRTKMNLSSRVFKENTNRKKLVVSKVSRVKNQLCSHSPLKHLKSLSLKSDASTCAGLDSNSKFVKKNKKLQMLR